MSPYALAKRALVTLLLELARMYGLTLNVNRDSHDDAIETGFRKGSVVVSSEHPSMLDGI